MKIAALVANYLLGLVFLVFGIIYFTPIYNLDSFQGQTLEWLQIMLSSKYMLVVKVTEIITGLMMVIGFRRPLAYVIAAPVVLNITFFHVFIMGQVFPVVSVVMIALLGFLFYANKEKYQPLLSA
jgi:putative oxidoreductase